MRRMVSFSAASRNLQHIPLELSHQAGAGIYSALILKRALAQSRVENAILA
jgi:hypothetical protein